MPYNTKEIRHAYKSKYNLNRENQVILLMITDGEKWNYLAVKSLSALPRGITVNNNGDFYGLNCFRSYTTKNKLKKHKNACENHDYCYIEMPEVKYNHGEKSMRAPFVIYTDLECLLEKMSICHNDPEKSSTTKVNKHTPCGYSLFTHCLFDRIKDCEDLKEHVTKIINYETKEMIPLTKKEEKRHNKQKICYICKKGFSANDNNKKRHKVKDPCYYTVKYRGADICNLRCKILKEIPVIFHNGSAYDYHFIIKEFKEQFECLRENTEKYITFSVPLKKELGNGKLITYKRKFIDSFRFMSSSLSSLVDNLSEGLHSDKCRDCKSSLDYTSVKDNQFIFRCFECKKNYKKEFNKELLKIFGNICEFCNKDINKFVLLLRKGVYPYEYMDSWGRFDETSLPDKENFYSSLKMKNITDIDYRHAKIVFKNLNNKNLGDYHDLYVQSDTLLLADVFENFRNICIEIYELDLTHFFICTRVGMASIFKKKQKKN